MTVFWRILQQLKKKKWVVLLLVIIAVITAGLDIITPIVAQKIIDRLVESLKNQLALDLNFLIMAALIILGATLAHRVIRAYYDYRLFTLVTKLEDGLRFKAFEKYLNLHILYHHEIDSGQIIGRIDRGASGVFAILHDILGHYLIPPLLIFVGVLAVLVTKNWLVALLVFLPLPFYLLITVVLTKKLYLHDRETHKRFEKVTKEEYDIAANIATVKDFVQEDKETRKQRTLLNRARNVQYKAERYWNVMELIQTIVATIGRVTVIVFGGWLVFTAKATIGEFVLFITLQNMAYMPLWQLSVLFPRLRRNLAKAERLFWIIDEKAKVVDKKGAQELSPFKDSIIFKNVSFGYFKDEYVLKNIDLTIPVNSTIALVGRSGSGKTTFVNLLLRSFDPQEGIILFDGVDIKEITQKSLRSQIAIVSQDVELFSRSIAENIAYGKPKATKEEIIEAAKLALAHNFIINTPQGYRTKVGERGIKLSGGQKQRVGIARAALVKPQILVLDEATSHLDTESERVVQQATRNLMKDRTTVIIAHRLSTVLHADKIIVFEKGRIEDIGTHQELVKRSPTYQHLYQLQFSE